MTKAIRIHETGGPDVLRFEDVDIGHPGPGEVRLQQKACGLNFIDVYQRTGLYPVPGLPSGLGLEGMGIVDAIGDGVEGLEIGQRVAYAGGPPGSYAEVRLIPAHRLVPLPDGIEEQEAASMMLKGLTAQYLLRRIYPVQPGDTIVFHAAAGGVGLIACQWAKYLGATVIGTVGSDEKAELARQHGCDHPIVYTREPLAERVREITNGEGVPVVYDSVGKDTFIPSLDCLRTRGLMVSFGNASGPVPAFEPAILAQKGSLFLTRPTLMHYTEDVTELRDAAAELFDAVLEGAVKIKINQTYPLAETAQAHQDLEARRTTGSTVLLP
jgi:NADPH2:quinone reductase